MLQFSKVQTYQWLVLILIGLLVTFFSRSYFYEREFKAFFVILLGIPLVVIIGTYFLRHPRFETALQLMMTTLPLTSTFVLNIGLTVRLNYFFAVLAVLFLLYHRNFLIIRKDFSVTCLHTYYLYALISVFFTLFVPDLENLTSEGLRGSQYRPFIQMLQLSLMMVVFHLILNYATSVERIVNLCTWIFWSLVLVALYGYYEFFAFKFGLPFINLVSGPVGVDFDPFIGNTRSLLGMDLPRPRAFMGETQFLTVYLMFAVPFSYISAIASKNKARRRLKLLLFLSFCLLFFLTNARSGLLALAVAALVSAFISRNFKFKLLAFSMFLFSIFAVGYWMHERLVALQLSASDIAALLHVFFLARENFLSDAISVFLVNPIFGVGIGNFIFYIDRSLLFSSKAMVPTSGSVYANVFSELGLIGLSIFLLFLGTIFHRLRRLVRNPPDSMTRTIAFAALFSFVGTMTCLVAVSGLYSDSHIWVLWALCIAVSRQTTSFASGISPP